VIDRRNCYKCADVLWTVLLVVSSLAVRFWRVNSPLFLVTPLDRRWDISIWENDLLKHGGGGGYLFKNVFKQ
jgi:hypothetical protein